MPFTDISLYNFRNIKNQKLSIQYDQVFFVGPNGQGKTNFLEALYLTAYGRSFRNSSDSVMFRHGEQEMSVSANWQIPNRSVVHSNISISFTTVKKNISINNKVIKDRKDLLEYIPAIIFSHEDIAFVNGSLEKRRWFFNQCLCRYKISFIDILQAYTKTLKNRNFSLKMGKFELIDVYNDQLAEFGSLIMQERKMLIEEFNSIFIPIFNEISNIGEVVSIEYSPSWKSNNTQDIINILENTINKDLRIQTTSTGIHRDKFYFRISNRDFLSEASTGQIRLISIILRLAQAQLYTKMSSREPILLLDDVLLELDNSRRMLLMEKLPSYDQIFFTFLPNEYIQKYKKNNSITYSVNAGEYTVVS